ncbi:helix-turn-helix domain-containing protein [Sporosarcina sp. ACRSL]|uniref:helix-turn-helix domain-containing protein n=1 Tax=Sporosarcina sp. ACRSL TaxID=2918215 RepID=UPI001EF60C97|nr:helix-turn-helix domain-containing protein [Sporosarcina sp. ACRSL]MCG7346465.1 helix-turn-helix domain-containing protein [Sporosarcina sp. ACRSL]
MVELTYEQCQQLFNINALLTQSLDERSVLQNLMKAAMDLVKRADTIIIYEWDENGYLTFSDGIGLDVEAIRNVKFRAGESITGRAFQQKRTFNVALEQAKAYMKNMSPENAFHFQRAVHYREVQSILAVPLIYQDKSIGVLVVDNFDTHGDVFSEEETIIIKILANQAAIALTNSRYYKELQRRNADLLTIQGIHEKFSAILLEGKGITQIVDVLNRIVTQPVSYSENAETERPQFPIVSSDEVLGYFHLSCPIEAYSSLEKVAIEQAANAVVLELIKQNNLFERENKMKEELFHKLMEGTWDHQMTYYSPFNKLTKYKSVTCILMEGRKKPLWLYDSIMSKERVMRKMENTLQRIDPDVIVFNRGFTVLVLAPKLSKAISSALKQLAKEYATAELVIGIGRNVHVQQVSDSYREANDALQLAKKSRERLMIRYEELGFERLWHSIDDDTLQQYVIDHLGPILHGDPVDFETLQTYIELNGRHKETAQQLSIHQNTLTYRLKKIEDALSVDLRDKKDLLRLMTAFEILDYLPTYAVSPTN